MKDDYLWDGSGEPDLEIQRLETVLARFRHDHPVLELREVGQSRPRSTWPRVLHAHFSLRLVAVGAMILVIVAFGIFASRPKPNPALRPGWDVAHFSGTPRVGSNSIDRAEGTSRLGIGQLLETNNESRATIRLNEIGEVSVEPNTRLRLLQTGRGQERLALERGTIHASIWAAPGGFVVATPSAVAVDLGCKYTLQVDDSGKGTLRTTMGWVGFKLDGHEAFIPAGAMCATRPRIGPGTPYFEDTPEPFRVALLQFDFEVSTPEARKAQLSLVLAQARKRDALTVWHLLARAGQSERGRVYERLSVLVPPPMGVTREGIMRLDPKMLDLWWNELGLGDVSLWRNWERSWPQSESGGK